VIEEGLYERLLAAIPPAEFRAADVDAESQVDLTLELLARARELREARACAA
jgi:hypothetical protein